MGFILIKTASKSLKSGPIKNEKFERKIKIRSAKKWHFVVATDRPKVKSGLPRKLKTPTKLIKVVRDQKVIAIVKKLTLILKCDQEKVCLIF